MISIITLEIENNGRFLTVEPEGRLTIGRETRRNSVDLPLEGDYISRVHGVFEPSEYGFTYTDQNSTNGTWLNGRLLNGGEPVNLRNGDVLQLCGGDPGQAEDITSIYYIVPTETLRSLTFDITGRMGALGAPDELDELPVISLDETSETLPDEAGTAYEPEEKDTEDKYEKEGDALDIDIRERRASSLGKSITLLRDVSMHIPAGKMVLILGGSGAGKTTFMNAVMGYEKADATIMYGDRDIYEEFDTMKFEIGYVPQQDLMRGSDSVYETLRNAAEMKLPISYGAKNREARIEYVLEMLGLGREKETAVARLSGGQRKRLSIALEYVSNPSLFFLDEPDSGLDGVMARSLMNSLRAIADEGKIIMVISHGPDRARELFDRVIVLAKSAEDNCGRLAFYGTVDEALEFFEVDTLEGVVMRINRQDEGGEGKADYYISKYAELQHER